MRDDNNKDDDGDDDDDDCGLCVVGSFSFSLDLQEHLF